MIIQTFEQSMYQEADIYGYHGFAILFMNKMRPEVWVERGIQTKSYAVSINGKLYEYEPTISLPSDIIRKVA